MVWWWTHVAAVAISLTWFAIRWVAALRAKPWVWAALPRAAAAVVDTVLLAAGVGLMVTRGWWPAVPVWLGFKWGLLLLYIALGHMALRPALPKAKRALAGTLAIAVAAHIVGAAITHHPAGLWLRGTAG